MTGAQAGDGPPRFLTDANFNLHIVVGLRRRQPAIDIVTAQQLGLLATPDPELLVAAKALDRILLTHDRRTIPTYLDDLLMHLPAGEHSPGVMSVAQRLPIGSAIDALLFVWSCSAHREWHDQFVYLPL